MNYRSKRAEKGLSQYTMARELGIDYQTYLEIDRGQRPLEGKYVDKFYDVLERAKEIKLNRLEKMKEVNAWLDSEQGLSACKEYGYSGAEIARILGITQGCMSTVINPNNKFHYMAGDDTKEMVYDFLHNPMNKKLKRENNKKIIKVDLEAENIDLEEVEKWYKRNFYDLKKLILEKGYKMFEFANIIGCSEVHLGNVIVGRRNASMGLKAKIYAVLNGKQLKEEIKEEKTVETPVEEMVEPKEEVKEEIKNEEISEDSKNLAKFVMKQGELIDQLVDENTRLKRQIKMYEKLIERM